MLSIIQAAGWPIWPLIACSVLALALIFERFISLKSNRIIPPKLLDEAISVSSQSLPGPDVVGKLAQNSALGEVLARHPRVLVMSDDIYAPIRYSPGAHATLAVECPDIADRVLTVSGVSKSHAMTASGFLSRGRFTSFL